MSFYLNLSVVCDLECKILIVTTFPKPAVSPSSDKTQKEFQLRLRRVASLRNVVTFRIVCFESQTAVRSPNKMP
jgi:hypothetical protein